MRKLIFLKVILVYAVGAWAQQDEIDSLQSILTNLKTKDTTYVNVLHEIAYRLSFTDQKESIHYINQAIETAKSIGYERGLLKATITKGSSYLIIGMPDQALSHYLEALAYNVDSYPTDNMRLNNNIGEVYRRKEVYDSSLAYFQRALQIAKEESVDIDPAIIYSNLGEVNLALENGATALKYFQLCLASSTQSNWPRGQGYGYYGLAECAFREGDFQKAIALNKKSIASRKLANHQRGLIQSYLKLANYYLEYPVRNLDSASYFWDQTVGLAKRHQANDLLNAAYNQLYDFYLQQSDVDMAVHYLNLHKKLDDSLRNSEFISNVEKMRAALQSELVNAENKLLKQQQLQQKAKEEARLIVVALAFIIVLGLGIATLQYRRKQQKIDDAEKEASFTHCLLDLSGELNAEHVDLRTFIEKLLRSSREVMQTDRAVYWSTDEENETIYLHSIDQLKGIKPVPETSFKLERFPGFIEEFLSNRTLAVSKISEKEGLADVFNAYFQPAGIESVLCAPVFINGVFDGLISYTMTRRISRTWQVHEQRFIASLADLIVVAVAKNRGAVLEQEKEDLIQKLTIRNKSLHEFNSVISHNLREPLTQVIGLSDLLKEAPKDANFDEIIGRISAATNRIDKVIKELSTVLNEKDPEPEDFKKVQLDRLFKEVLDLLKTEIADRNITIEQNLELKEMITYKAFLSDALYHLLSNSLKFSDHDQRLHLKIDSYEDEYHAYIQISDNGRGIDLTHFGDKIFKMYQRYHTEVDGRGIGLFIVKNRITSLNGLIKVNSEEGEGTTFTIEFPKKVEPVSLDN